MFRTVFLLTLSCWIVVDVTRCEDKEDTTGFFCLKDSDCREGEFCSNKVCDCERGYVRIEKFCFRESSFGEPCWYDDQCSDFRQICSNTTNKVQRCICDNYHEYDYEISQCVPKRNLMDMLNTKYRYEELIAKEADRTFFGLLLAGLLVAVVGFACTIISFLYCFRMYITDKKLDESVEALSLKAGKPLKTSSRKPADDKQLTEASIGPICVGSVVIG